MFILKWFKDFPISVNKKFILFCFVIIFTAHENKATEIICPSDNGTLRRIGKTRFYIIHDTGKRGDFVTIDGAKQECKKRGLKMASLTNMLSLAVFGREIEKMAFKEKMKDTWYWLDAKYNYQTQKYHWGDGKDDEVTYSLYLHRPPRPIGVGAHINFNNRYEKHRDQPQCLTVALPWLGSADHNKSTTVFYGHQTTFDERDCESKKKRHAICEIEGDCKTCDPVIKTPFTLDEGKADYFENGDWIFGDRKYVLNWKPRMYNDTEKYCKSIGLNVMMPGALEKFMIPHVKMWSRGVTAAQFWTSLMYNETTKQYLDRDGNVVANNTDGANFTGRALQEPRSTKYDKLFCVALSFVYEFKEQMPCTNYSNAACQWSFIRYVPANCNNYHGSICQHDDYDNRNISWFPKFKNDLTEVLTKTALTSEFGYKGNNGILRSKYKQTFGLCYCPKGYRMLRSKNDSYTAWAMKPFNTSGKEIFEYDYQESYWVVDKHLYNKSTHSNCTISYIDNSSVRRFKEVRCIEWHFYLCEKYGQRPTKKLNIVLETTAPMEWRQGPQPRIYPLTRRPNPNGCKKYDTDSAYRFCHCRQRKVNQTYLCDYDSSRDRCESRIFETCPNVYRDIGYCQRKGDHIYYSFDGLVCNSQHSSDNYCNIEKTIYAVNFGNTTATDNRGIVHQDGQNLGSPGLQRLQFHDKSGKRKGFVKGKCNSGDSLDLPKGDEQLYENCLELQDYCFSFSEENMAEGVYEFTARTKVSEAKFHGNDVNIRLNGKYIVQMWGPKYQRDRYYPVEFNYLFEIKHKQEEIDSSFYGRNILYTCNITLEFCSHNCGSDASNRYFQINSLSIVKFASNPITKTID